MQKLFQGKFFFFICIFLKIVFKKEKNSNNKKKKKDCFILLACFELMDLIGFDFRFNNNDVNRSLFFQLVILLMMMIVVKIRRKNKINRDKYYIETIILTSETKKKIFFQ